MEYKVIELFSGIGAQRMAFIRACIPHKVIATSDINKFANQSYKAIYKNCPNLGDICKIQALPKSDIVTYSFPYTDLSIIKNNRTGMAEGANHRSSLIWEVKRLLEQCQKDDTLPRWLLMENVPAINDVTNRPQFEKWLDFLNSMGYTSKFKVLWARDFGMAQNRKRMFVLSLLGDECPDLPIGSGPRHVLEDILEDNVDARYYPKQTYEMIREVPSERVYDRCVQVCNYGHSKFRMFSSVYSVKGLSPTITSSHSRGKWIYSKDFGVRRTTEREMWRLQGFPDWAFDKAEKVCSKTQLAYQAGNSIPVPVLEAIFNTIWDWDTQHGVDLNE